jgi:hypothetical protein
MILDAGIKTTYGVFFNLVQEGGTMFCFPQGHTEF